MTEIENAGGIRKIFERVHRRYRLVNSLLTMGLDRRWRRRAAGIAAEEASGGRWLDVCTGTGDMAFRLLEAAPEGTSVYGLDFTMPMIKTAREDPRAGGVGFILGNAAFLPFREGSFDLITVSFSTRNMNLGPQALSVTFREFRRVLKPGGLFVNLETSQPSSPLIRKAFHVLVSLYVAPAGRIVSGAGEAYRYLSASIPRFYPPGKLAGIMKEAGFVDISFLPMTLGAVALHHGRKPVQSGAIID
ncbi:MAG: ubiquinone/menaquinone biosynthesis methyltransferase [Candidatus Krumholzibacteriota bacterium]